MASNPATARHPARRPSEVSFRDFGTILPKAKAVKQKPCQLFKRLYRRTVQTRLAQVSNGIMEVCEAIAASPQTPPHINRINQLQS